MPKEWIAGEIAPEPSGVGRMAQRRAQLGVDVRLLEPQVPGIHASSADDGEP